MKTSSFLLLSAVVISVSAINTPNDQLPVKSDPKCQFNLVVDLPFDQLNEIFHSSQFAVCSRKENNKENVEGENQFSTDGLDKNKELFLREKEKLDGVTQKLEKERDEARSFYKRGKLNVEEIYNFREKVTALEKEMRTSKLNYKWVEEILKDVLTRVYDAESKAAQYCESNQNNYCEHFDSYELLKFMESAEAELTRLETVLPLPDGPRGLISNFKISFRGFNQAVSDLKQKYEASIEGKTTETGVKDRVTRLTNGLVTLKSAVDQRGFLDE